MDDKRLKFILVGLNKYKRAEVWSVIPGSKKYS
jgi:hypothetical protein